MSSLVMGGQSTRNGIILLGPGSASYQMVWDAEKDNPRLKSSRIAVKVTAANPDTIPYMVVNLETGKYHLTINPPDLSDDTCRTTELWLRWIPAGTFMMGSPGNELGREDDETQHQVTLTRGYYIGVFELTQKQWELVTGEDSPSNLKGDTRPVEGVTYNAIRGSNAGSYWPDEGHAVDSSCFLGELRAKTGGVLFDLPTEAQWEYACRAGTTAALNSGKNLTNAEECPNMAEVGRYCHNKSDGKGGYSEHTKVGSYLPNAWGLYDMHGNVSEYCLDWYGGYPTAAVSDPTGVESGWYRVSRGGNWYNGYGAQNCRSANRNDSGPSNSCNYSGFRVVCVPPGQ